MNCYICKKKIEKDFFILDGKKICIECGKNKVTASVKNKMKRITVGV